MSDQFIGEVRVFPFNFAPVGWVQCNGQLLPINQFTTLFAVIGVAYGGDGTTTFAVPNLIGSAPLCVGQGVGLSGRVIGETGGSASVTLQTPNMPSHSHPVQVSSHDTMTDSSKTPSATTIFGKALTKASTAYVPITGNQPLPMSPVTVMPAGSSQGHNNLPPYLVLNLCMATEGNFPPHS
jgi:microcystin-dependent protein